MYVSENQVLSLMFWDGNNSFFLRPWAMFVHVLTK